MLLPDRYPVVLLPCRYLQRFGRNLQLKFLSYACTDCVRVMNTVTSLL